MEAYEYDPYGHHSVLSDTDQDGNLIFDHDHASDTSGVSPLGNPYRFTGRRFFSRTGLQYSRHRWYDPDAGRFLSRDSIGYAGGG